MSTSSSYESSIMDSPSGYRNRSRRRRFRSNTRSSSRSQNSRNKSRDHRRRSRSRSCPRRRFRKRRSHSNSRRPRKNSHSREKYRRSGDRHSRDGRYKERYRRPVRETHCDRLNGYLPAIQHQGNNSPKPKPCRKRIRQLSSSSSSSDERPVNQKAKLTNKWRAADFALNHDEERSPRGSSHHECYIHTKNNEKLTSK